MTDHTAAAELVMDRLRQLGVTLTAVGDRIRCRPASAVPPELLDDLRRHKPEIIRHLTAELGTVAWPTQPVDSAQLPGDEKAGEAEVLLNQLLDEGSTFRVISESGQDFLVWFGPSSSVTPEVGAQVTRLKTEIIALLRNRHPKSRRRWGEPEGFDWLEHPGRTVDADEGGA